MINKIKKNTQERMEKSIEILKNQISKVHTGRATPNLLKNIMIEYYGTVTSLHKLANIVAENSRTLAITVFDRILVPVVEKAIITSDLGFNPSSVGAIIRVTLPPLTEERRKYLIKVVRNNAEHGRISIRNARRDANDKIKALLRGKEITEDAERRAQDAIQRLTNNFIKKVDEALEQKEKELIKF